VTTEHPFSEHTRRLIARWCGVTIMLALAMNAAPTAVASGSADRASRPPCSSMTPTPGDVEGGPLSLTATTATVGCIGLTVHGATASSVTIAETGSGAAATAPVATLSTQDGTASLATGLAWLCDRTTRTFQVTEKLPDGTEQLASTSVTTPSCAKRLSAHVLPLRLHRGYPATLAVADRWELGGVRVHACIGKDRTRACVATTLKPGRGATLLRLRPRSAGQLTIAVSGPDQVINLALHVLSSRPVLLATGDSEMQVLDDDLASDLSGGGGARVVGDARQSTAISSPFFFNWPGHAFGQVAEHHPDIVAMFLGGNEGFRLGSAECCGTDWSREYAARVAGMMRVYRQQGAASVYWFLIPTPSKEPFVKVVRAVNRGIVSAAAQFPEGVHFFDLRPVFSPGGRYIDSLSHDGRTITVHETDGFHLSESSDRLVAQMFIEQLRHDGVLP
jgi:GDSL-like Lipase/Acylhydrolase family